MREKTTRTIYHYSHHHCCLVLRTVWTALCDNPTMIFPHPLPHYKPCICTNHSPTTLVTLYVVTPTTTLELLLSVVAAGEEKQLTTTTSTQARAATPHQPPPHHTTSTDSLCASGLPGSYTLCYCYSVVSTLCGTSALQQYSVAPILCVNSALWQQ